MSGLDDLIKGVAGGQRGGLGDLIGGLAGGGCLQKVISGFQANGQGLEGRNP